MALSKEKQLELDRDLMELALQQFDLFCLVAGVDKEQAYICMEQRKGRSLGSIAQSMGVSRQAISQRCKKCQG